MPEPRAESREPRAESREIIPPVSVGEHKAQGPAAVSCYILTVSDTRTLDTIPAAAQFALSSKTPGTSSQDTISSKTTPLGSSSRLRERLADPGTHVIICTGGTGISSRDGTFEAVTGLLEKRLDGFGELFRMISFEEIGAAAMLSRATAGTVGRKAIFALPGSEKAVRLAMTRLVIPELGHVVQQLSK